MISLNPYLVYNGNCEEAFNFYKMVFGAEELYLGRYQDVPQDARKYFPNAADEHIMHASLKIDEKTVIMGNDSAEIAAQLTTALARDFYLYIDLDEPKEAIRIFNELSAGGKIIVPIAQSFWSPCYGVLNDRFGIHWKITAH
jgi:PhnB protein